MAETRPGRRPRCVEARPDAAAVARGTAKIERPEAGAPSGAASTGADTSKTLRRPPVELSEVRGIYIREPRTLKTGPPPAASPAGRKRV